VFNQLEARFQPKDFEGGTLGGPSGEWNVLLADGGIFDNLGLEKVTSAQTILVSNGGKGAEPLPAPAGIDQPLTSATISSPAKTQFDALRWILGNESRDAAPAKRRLENLARRFATNEVAGAYW